MPENANNPNRLTLGVISEIHLTPPGVPNAVWHNELRFDLGLSLLIAALDELRRRDVDAIALLGDLTNIADSESLHQVRKVLLGFGKPVVALSGNHDITTEQDSASSFQEFFSDAGISAPPQITVLHGYVVQLLGLERNAQTNTLHSLGPPITHPNDAVSIVMSHYPLLPLTETLGVHGLKHAGDITDLAVRTGELAALEDPAIVLHGHLHVRETTVIGPVLHLSFAALVEPPHECAVLTISTLPGCRVRVDRAAFAVHASDVARLPVLSEAEETWLFDEETWSQAARSAESWPAIN